MRLRKILDLTMIGLLGSVLVLPSARSTTLTSTTLIEDFSTDTFADYTATTGLWNLVDHVAQAGVVADATGSFATRPLSFGDGSDGALNSAAGFAFDTNAHPNGYNFSSVNITAGPITVTGANPLVIRSLTTVNIVPQLTVSGPSGSAGAANGTNTGAAGATAVTCSAPSGGDGGAGGGATSTTAANGNDGFQTDSSDESSTGGTAQLGGVYNGGEEASTATDGPSSSPTPGDFDTAANFICGAGAGGGGAYAQNPGTYATGGGGGAGGGRFQIVAVGNLSVSDAEANGGNGGNGAGAVGACSGNGGGGVGGAIWLQTYKTLTTGADPLVNEGSSGFSACQAAINTGFFAGIARGDANAGAPGWSTTSYSTADAAATKSYVIQSKSYDLGTGSATFANAPTVTSALNLGTIAVTYAGSVDNVTFSAFVADITTLSSLGYRYLKFNIAIGTAGAPGPSPQVSQISLVFGDANPAASAAAAAAAAAPPGSLALKLSPGCATVAGFADRDSSNPNVHASPSEVLRMLAGWLLFGLVMHRILRAPSSHRRRYLALVRKA